MMEDPLFVFLSPCLSLILHSTIHCIDCSIGVINGGGIRASFQQGNVSYGDVLTVFPFSDGVMSFVVNGTILQQILELSASRIGHGGMLQISGLRIVYDDKPSLVSAQVLIGESEWEPIDPNRRYRMAATEFLIEGGDGYYIMGENAEGVVDYGEASGDVCAVPHFSSQVSFTVC
jgi:5'-nucleotidase / UDP-sugar diphosphatase